MSKKINEQLIFWLVLLGGIFIRIWQLGQMPSEVATDEGFSAYEAYSLLLTGLDTFGNHNPVYLISWGSGMNVLQSYLMIPFIKLFGMHLWVIRLPQVIVACISLPVFYLTVKRMFSQKTAMIAFFLLTISPWHIMMSRWGLESNLAPGFLLFGFYFFLRGCENNRYFLLSSLFYGLSLYCYSTLWVYVPLVLLFQAFWLFRHKEINWNRWMTGAVLLLLFLAIPLMLFVMVNIDLIGEIHNSWFSVPKLVAMRTDGYSLTHIFQNFINFCKRFLLQWDWVDSAAIKPFGLFYQFSMPFAIVGLVKIFKKLIRGGQTSSLVFTAINLIVGLFVCLIVHVNITRMNFMHMWTLILIVIGVEAFISTFPKWRSPLIALYTASFLIFSFYYVNVYDIYNDGLEEAVAYAKKQDGIVYIGDGINYPKIMYYTQISPDEYRDTVTFSNYPNEFLAVTSFGRYKTYITGYEGKGIYIFEKGTYNKDEFSRYQIKTFGDYDCIIV